MFCEGCLNSDMTEYVNHSCTLSKNVSVPHMAPKVYILYCVTCIF